MFYAMEVSQLFHSIIIMHILMFLMKILQEVYVFLFCMQCQEFSKFHCFTGQDGGKRMGLNFDRVK